MGYSFFGVILVVVLFCVVYRFGMYMVYIYGEMVVRVLGVCKVVVGAVGVACLDSGLFDVFDVVVAAGFHHYL